jgi:hypothetical protein
MALIPWNPFGETLSLRDALARLFDEAIWRPGPVQVGMSEQEFVPAMDISETPDE